MKVNNMYGKLCRDKLTHLPNSTIQSILRFTCICSMSPCFLFWLLTRQQNLINLLIFFGFLRENEFFVHSTNETESKFILNKMKTIM